MKDTMIKLWRGEGITESEHCRERERELVKRLCQYERELHKQLDDNGRELLEALQDAHGEIASLEKEEAFSHGMTMGLRLMAEALEE